MTYDRYNGALLEYLTYLIFNKKLRYNLVFYYGEKDVKNSSITYCNTILYF